MEDKKQEQFNNLPDDLPRRPDGKIDIEKICTGKDKNNNYIVPDNILSNYYKELPNGTINQSKTKRAFNGGLLGVFGGDPEADLEKQRKGREAQAAAYRQRQTNAEMIDIIYSRKAPDEVIERLGLKADATVIEAINAAQALEAMKGNSKAYEVLRDTAGEKPTDKIDANITGLTAEDKELLKNVENRISSQE